MNTRSVSIHSTYDLIGNTPLVELVGLSATPDVRILAKVEFFNLTSSVKARAASNILKQAREDGLLQEGSVILDASSGNTGLAASLAAIHGYHLKLCLPENANEERKECSEPMVLR